MYLQPLAQSVFPTAALDIWHATPLLPPSTIYHPRVYPVRQCQHALLQTSYSSYVQPPVKPGPRSCCAQMLIDGNRLLSSNRANTLSSSPFVRRDLSSIGTQAAQKWNRLAFAPSSSVNYTHLVLRRRWLKICLTCSRRVAQSSSGSSSRRPRVAGSGPGMHTRGV